MKAEVLANFYDITQCRQVKSDFRDMARPSEMLSRSASFFKKTRSQLAYAATPPTMPRAQLDEQEEGRLRLHFSAIMGATPRP